MVGNLGLSKTGILLLLHKTTKIWSRFQDYELTKPVKRFAKLEYSKQENGVCFDIDASLFNSGTNHEHDQPPHLKILNQDLPTQINVPIFNAPETK